MAMTDEEKFRFDLTGFLVRPGILNADEIASIRDQIYRIYHDRESLPPAHRAMPGGPASVLIDHPRVLEVLHEIIGPDIRLENTYPVWRKKGECHGALHGGGPQQADPIFGYRVLNGRIHAGMVRVVFELTDIEEGDQATHFVVGSHKVNFTMHPDHLSLEPGKRSPFLMGYTCPAGSAVFFTENVCHAGPVWTRDEPRVGVLNAYAHLATHWHRLTIPPEVLKALPREKQAYFRQPWVADFRTDPATRNTMERFVAGEEPPVDTDHRP
ncbi:MAG: phytanoyl-CoA dioxygenase family protein [candidate division Zixibacteria bacterium]|nr:phytanoyl-CoA dioxygenase family protein [candidate division Zixibacteria bacterium]